MMKMEIINVPKSSVSISFELKKKALDTEGKIMNTPIGFVIPAF